MLLETTREASIPWSYRSDLTRLIYKVIGRSDKSYASWLHDEGYEKGGKVYRLFVYSDLQFAPIEVSPSGLKSEGCIVWQLGSPDGRFIKALADGVKLLGNKLDVFGSTFDVLDTLQAQLPKTKENPVFRTISPVVASVQEGKGSTPTYLSPEDQKFTEALERNLFSKWEAYNKRSIEVENFGIRTWDPKSKLIPTFDINVRAWNLKLQIWGSDEMTRFAYDAGLGERNSQGFGMIDLEG
jgi:CRISPR-associated endoribonuclease Cas6